MNPFISSDGHLRNGWRFLIAVFVFIVTENIAGRLALLTHAHGPKFEALYRPLHVILLLVAFSLMVKFIDRVPGDPLAAQGLGTSGPWLRDIVLGFLFGTGMVTISVVAIGIFGDLSFAINLNDQSIPRALLVLWVLAWAAMLEEVAFRGYPFQKLVAALYPVDRSIHMPSGTSAIVVLSILFGAGHLNNPHATLFGAANTVLVGILLSIAYLRTRSLWMPFGIHFGWNLTLGMIFGLPVSGITSFSVIVKGVASGPHWLTGGDYGIEASATASMIILLGILLLVMFVPGRTSNLEGVTGSSSLASNN
jgi:membrane protease YdiL (CAAX protease family)